MTTNDVMKMLYDMAKNEKDMRFKRYLMEKAREIDNALRQGNAERHLENLTTEAVLRLRKAA